MQLGLKIAVNILIAQIYEINF